MHIKKFFVIVPIIASCNGLKNASNMVQPEGQTTDTAGKSNSDMPLPSKLHYDIAPLFEEFLTTAWGDKRISKSLSEELQEMIIWFKKHEKEFSTYDARVEYISELIKPYKDLIAIDHLLDAAFIGFTEFGQVLCDNGCNPNQLATRKVCTQGPGRNVQTSALGMASYQGHIPFLDMLLRYKADVNGDGVYRNKPARADRTPAYLAAYAGKYSSIDWLVKHGADVNRPNRQTWTPLQEAAKQFDEHKGIDQEQESKYLKTMELLLNVSLEKTSPESILEMSARVDHPIIFDLLFKKCEVNQDAKDKAMSISKSGLRLYNIECLAKHGVKFEINNKSQGGEIAHKAVRLERIPILKLYFNAGGDKKVLYGGATLLDQAKDLNWEEGVAFLIAEGANSSAKDK